MNIHRKLKNYCCWNNPFKVKKILDKNDYIDLTYDDGIYFSFAFSHDNLEMLQILLDYYEEHNLQHPINSIEYKKAKSALKEILEENIDIDDIDDEMLHVIKPYLVIDPLYELESLGEKHYSDDDLEFTVDDHELNFDSKYFEPMSEDVDLAGNSLVEAH